MSLFLEPGATKLCEPELPFFTAVRWIERSRAPVHPKGIEDCDEEELREWEANRYAMVPYQFKKENRVQPVGSPDRILTAEERAKRRRQATQRVSSPQFSSWATFADNWCRRHG